MRRLYIWRGFVPAARPWIVCDAHWLGTEPFTYVRRFATHAEAIEHAQWVALSTVPVALEVTC